MGTTEPPGPPLLKSQSTVESNGIDSAESDFFPEDENSSQLSSLTSNLGSTILTESSNESEEVVRPIKLDLQELIDIMKSRDTSEDVERFQLVLNGQFMDRPVIINLEGFMEAQESVYSKTLDIDSVMFNCKDFQHIQSDVSIIEFPNITSAITKNYLKPQLESDSIHQLENALGSSNPEPKFLHQVPNFKLGSFGSNSLFQIHVFFPKLRRFTKNRWVNYLKEEILARFYDEVVIPAMHAATPRYISQHYALTYEQAKVRARNLNGSYSYESKLLERAYVENFFDQVLLYSSCIDEFEDIFFHIHAKGIKLITKTADEFHALELLEESFGFINWREIPQDSLFVDLGVEYHSVTAGTTCVWSGTFAKSFLRNTVKTYKPEFHPYLQMITIGGASSCHMKRNCAIPGLVYVQLYMNDKEVFYNFRKKGIFDFTPQHLINGNNAFKLSLENFQNILEQTKLPSASYSARVEYRLPIQDLIENRTYIVELTDQSSERMYLIPTVLLNTFKQELGITLLDYGLKVSSLSNELDKVINAVLIYNYCHSLIRVPDQFKTKYLSIIFYDWAKRGEQYGWFSTLILNCETKSVSRDPREIENPIRLLRKSLGIHWKGRTTILRDRQQRPNSIVTANNPVSVTHFSSLTPEETLRKCLDNIFNSLPLIGNQMEIIVDKTNLVPEFFQSQEWASLVATKKTRRPWMERFGDFFPTTDEELVNLETRSGSKNFSYYRPFLQWWNESNSAMRADFRNMFERLLVLPFTEKKKAYVLKKVVWLIQQ